jgi:AraC-like DNA-binding protein
MSIINQLFSTFKVTSQIFHNGQYCGSWSIDTSGKKYISFHIVNHGRCFLTVGDSPEVYTLEEGDVVLFPNDIRHCLTNDETFSQPINSGGSITFDEGIKEGSTGIICGYFVHNHPLIGNITSYLPDKVVLRRAKLSKDNSSAACLLEALLKESLSDKIGAELVMNKIAEALLALVFRTYLPANHGVIAAMSHPQLSKVIQAIHSNPENKWTVDNMAELCFLSRAKFSDLFKSVLMETPMNYLTQWRISVAYRMLADEKVSTLHAAIACGYDNESSFSKAFKRLLGVNPGAVRAGEA